VHVYEHTQIGTLMRLTLGWGSAVAAVVAALIALNEPSAALIPVIVASVLLVCALLFHSLTVEVSRDFIALRFGVGIIRKRFPVPDVQSAAIVRNRWYYGWGVKYTPHGWLYNVSGLDAIELQFRNGRKCRIGTDEPVELLAAIESAVGDSS